VAAGGDERTAALEALAEAGELPAGQLAARTSLTPATVTQMLESLSAAGMVERTRSERDRRVVTTRLTPEGRRRLERKQAALSAKWQDATADLDAGELEAASRVVRRLSSYLDEL
jgi:DNA-binding MarR family transcriptional regulator